MCLFLFQLNLIQSQFHKITLEKENFGVDKLIFARVCMKNFREHKKRKETKQLKTGAAAQEIRKKPDNNKTILLIIIVMIKKQ